MVEFALAIHSQEEATIKLAAATARRKVMRAERHLAMCLAQEHDALRELYYLQAEQSEKEVAVAENGIGDLRHAIRTRGFQLVDTTPRTASHSNSDAFGPASWLTRKRKLASC